MTLLRRSGNPEDIGEPGEHGPSSQCWPGAVTSGSSGHCPKPVGARQRREAALVRRYPGRRDGGLGRLGECVAATRTGPESALAQDLDQRFRPYQAGIDQLCTVTSSARRAVEGAEVDLRVGHAERVGEPLSLGMRCIKGSWPPSKPTGTCCGLLTLGTAAGGLLAAAGPSTDTTLGLGHALGRARSWSFTWTPPPHSPCAAPGRSCRGSRGGRAGRWITRCRASPAPAACRDALVWSRWPSGSA